MKQRHAAFLLGLFLNPENGDDIFLQKAASFSADFMALCPRRQNSSLYQSTWRPITNVTRSSNRT
jgi:hypothetical protein